MTKKEKELTSNGTYVDRRVNAEKLDSQELFYEMAYKNAEKDNLKHSGFYFDFIQIYDRNKDSTVITQTCYDGVCKEGQLSEKECFVFMIKPM